MFGERRISHNYKNVIKMELFGEQHAALMGFVQGCD